MCRLYGFRAAVLTQIECALVRAQNALVVQSRNDGSGFENADGWGIGFYAYGHPVVEKCAGAAYDDSKFLLSAKRIRSTTVVAHVRRATVGGATWANTHPFQVGAWLFAHNGTLTAFDRLEESLEAEITPDLLETRRGTTDSEIIFLWLMSRMVCAGIASNAICRDHELLAEVFAQAIRDLASRNAAVGAGSRARLNFLLTDGVTLAASRWGNSLYWSVRERAHACGICGSYHVDDSRVEGFRACAIASEPITSEAWVTVPDRSLMIITPELAVNTGPIA